jgi:hypothetical protein
MKKTLIIFYFIASVRVVTAQNVDSLYNVFFDALRITATDNHIQTGETEPVKCGLFYVKTLRDNFDKLTISQQNEIASVLTRPSTQASVVTPSGNFRIHFDTTGANKIGYDITELAEALDSVWKFEIDILGYPPPPPDEVEGGDELYDVYIQDLGIIYGWTDSYSNSSSPSYMTIDNDFDVHYTTGINGAKVTVAHEFHHAIQLGNYKYKSEDTYYYELLSTSMEEFVFDSINDYYDYIGAYYRRTDLPFYGTLGGGYDLAIWNLFLKERYGFDVIKRGLENVVNTSALEAMADAISEFGGSFKEDFTLFGVWNFFTGSRSKKGEYFEESDAYPLVEPLQTIQFDSNSKSLMVNSNPSSNNYLRFVDKSRGLPDTLVSIITNSDYLSQSRRQFEYTVYNYQASDAEQINGFYYSKLSALYKSYFSESVIFNNELAFKGKTERTEIDYSFPQPFDYNKHSTVFIPTGKDISGKAYLNVYSTSMDLVFSGEKDIFAIDKIVVRWDGKTNSGEKLPTGIYIYVTKAGDTVKKGKIVIYNE